jgi:hypothetical protein
MGCGNDLTEIQVYFTPILINTKIPFSAEPVQLLFVSIPIHFTSLLGITDFCVINTPLVLGVNTKYYKKG